MLNNIVIYQSKSGSIELKGDFKNETIWATQAQIAEAFDVNVRTTNEHKYLQDRRAQPELNYPEILDSSKRRQKRKAMCKKCTLQIQTKVSSVKKML
jgi:hypothetical protein